MATGFGTSWQRVKGEKGAQQMAGELFMSTEMVCYVLLMVDVRVFFLFWGDPFGVMEVREGRHGKCGR